LVLFFKKELLSSYWNKQVRKDFFLKKEAKTFPHLGRRTVLLAPAALISTPAEKLRVGDQRGGYKSLMEAAGVQDPNIEWSLFAAAAPLLEALNAGAIDVGGAGDAPFVFARAAGIPARAISATRSSGASTAIVVPGNSTAKTFADLRGRRIGTGKGSVGHFLILAARDQAGLAPSDIDILFLAPSDAKAALASGTIDAWSTWGQYVYLAVAQDGARILRDGAGLMSGLSYEVASETAIATRRHQLTDFVRRLTEALHWGLANTDRYAEAWAAETHVPIEVARATLRARGFTPAVIDATLIADQQRTIDLFVRHHVLPAPQDAAAGFNTSFNQATQ